MEDVSRFVFGNVVESIASESVVIMPVRGCSDHISMLLRYTHTTKKRMGDACTRLNASKAQTAHQYLAEQAG
jgi:hypothetical protein